MPLSSSRCQGCGIPNYGCKFCTTASRLIIPDLSFRSPFFHRRSSCLLSFSSVSLSPSLFFFLFWLLELIFFLCASVSLFSASLIFYPLLFAWSSHLKLHWNLELHRSLQLQMQLSLKCMHTLSFFHYFFCTVTPAYIAAGAYCFCKKDCPLSRVNSLP